MRAKKVDANHGETREFLRSNGWCVTSLASIGYGLPDLLVARDFFTALIEVKDGSKSPSRRKLRKAQEEFRKMWPGVVITSLNPQHALLQLEAWRLKCLANPCHSINSWPPSYGDGNPPICQIPQANRWLKSL